MDILVFVLLTLGIGLVSALSFINSWLQHRSGSLPPGPFSFPIVGCLFSLKQPLHEHFARLSKRYGPMLYLKIGSVSYLVANTAEAAEQILKTHDVEFADRPDKGFLRFFSFGWKDMFLLPYGNKWRKMRRITNVHVFSNKMLDSSAAFRSLELQAAVKSIKKSSASGEPVDLRAVIAELIAGSLSLTLFGRKDLRFVKIIDEITEITLALNLGEIFPALDWMDLHGVNRRMGEQVMPRFKSILSEHVEEHRKMKAQAGGSFVTRDFTDALISLEREDELDEISIIALLADMIAAGLETSKSTVEFAMAELISNPELMLRAQQELDNVLGTDRATPVQESDLQKLPFIDAIMKETLRLHPAAPLAVPHQNRNEVKLNGRSSVPARCRVLINIWAVGRDEKHWSDPEKFQPDRFLNSGLSVTGQHFQLIPFSAGRRICAGLPLAVRFMALILATFLREFDWGLAPGETSIDFSEVAVSLTTKFATKLVASAKPRNS